MLASCLVAAYSSPHMRTSVVRIAGIAALLIAGASLAALPILRSENPSSAAGLVRRVTIPGIARDENPPVTSGNRHVLVTIEMDIHEPALLGSGFTIVSIRATANGPLPGQFDPPVTVPVSASITTHSADICAWSPTVINTNLTMTYSQPQGSDLRLQFGLSPFEWFYMVECPGQTIRFPAGAVNESITGWMNLVLGMGGPGGATIDTPVSTGGQECVKRRGLVSNTNAFGAGAIHVWVTQSPCLVVAD